MNKLGILFLGRIVQPYFSNIIHLKQNINEFNGCTVYFFFLLKQISCRNASTYSSSGLNRSDNSNFYTMLLYVTVPDQKKMCLFIFSRKISALYKQPKAGHTLEDFGPDWMPDLPPHAFGGGCPNNP